MNAEPQKANDDDLTAPTNAPSGEVGDTGAGGEALLGEGTTESAAERTITDGTTGEDDENGMLVEVAEGVEGGEAMDTSESAASPSLAAATISALSNSNTPAVQKKFTSLNVNRRFLEKASPTLPAATVAASSKPSASLSSSRLSTVTPASRLTSAKLSSSVKPQPAGWGQVASTASPVSAAPSPDPLPSSSTATNAASGGALGAGSTAATSSPAAKPNSSMLANAPVAASPKLVTALTSGTMNRSTSPHNKGSPGLRNAALAASGRSATPSVAAPSVSSSNKAPWARVKADAMPKSSANSSDFPTAAEAAKAKMEAERREKAAVAEAAAKAEQALQQLERYRGTSLGAGNHWDEMDDEDDLDEVVQFGDGTQYKVPVKKDEEEPVSKEERFKDVGHDRSWPPRSSDMAPPPTTTTTSSSRPTLGTRTSSAREPASDGAPPSAPAPARAFQSRPNKVEIRGGEGISLDTEAPADRGHGYREGRPFFRRDEEGQGSRPAAQSSAPAPARAWGPLAQRQASLNPDAPKPAVLSPPSLPKVAPPAPPTPAAPPTAQAVRPPHQREESEPVSSLRPAQSAHSTAAPPPLASKSTGSERGLPPHLAANYMPAQKAIPPHRIDREPAILRSEVQATPYGAKARPAVGDGEGGATSSQAAVSEEAAPSKASPVTRGDSQREEMLSAAERARKRRQEEEDRRMAERERAKAKAAAIEEKIRAAKAEEEERKRLVAEEESKRRQEEEQRVEEGRRREAERQRGRAEQPELGAAHVKAANERGGQRVGVANLLSPSDEAVSWRRAKPASGPPAPPSTGVEARLESDQVHPFRDIRPVPLESAPPQQPLTLLQRSGPRSQGAGGATLSKERDLASSTGMEGWDVVINRIKDSIPASSLSPSEVKIPTGPRGARAGSGAESSARAAAVKVPGKAPRVEIIAPTDEGAAKQLRMAEQRQREARQTQGPPVGVLKLGNGRGLATKAEETETRKEIGFDAAPVWNRCKVKVGLSNPPPRLPRHLAKAQAVRVAGFKNESSAPKPVNILTWEPPIGNLSSRTLSRDDQFFPKKYRKGLVITNVSVPTARLERKPVPSLSTSASPIVKVPATRAGKEASEQPSNAAHWRAHPSSSPSMATTAAVPRAPASMRARAAPGLVQPDDSGTAREGRRQSDAGRRESAGVVAFARSLGPRDSSTPSPVNFMATSELKMQDRPQVSLPLSTLPASTALPAKSPPRSMLPSPNQMGSTWGENTLTFAGLDSSEPTRGTADRDHIKNVWALPSGDNGKELAPKQNSLRGIVDEFPSTMTLSMQDLRGDDGAIPTAAQYHDVGINTSATVDPPSASNRAYSPLPSSNGKLTEASNGFTSASSPSTTKSSPSQKVTGNGQTSGSGGPSQSLAMSPSYQARSPQAQHHHHHLHQQSPASHPHGHHQQARVGSARSSSTGFSPYAYPSPLQDYAGSDLQGGFLNGQQRPYAASHRYPPLDGGYGGGNGANAYGPYRGNPVSPSMPVMPTSTAGWPIDSGAGGGYYGGGSPLQQQQHAPWDSMMMSPSQQQHHQPHHQRISSSASRFHPSSSGGPGPLRGPTGNSSSTTANRHNLPLSGANVTAMQPGAGSKAFTGSSSGGGGTSSNNNNQRDEGQGANSSGGAANSSPSSMRYRAYDSSSAVW